MSTKTVRAPRTRKPSEKRINTLFNHKLFEALAWRMQQAEQFSDDAHAIAGADFQLWDIVIGDRFESGKYRFGVVTATDYHGTDAGRCNNIGISELTAHVGFDNAVRQGSVHTIYFDSDQTYRTITELELVDVFAAMEVMYATDS